MKLDLSSASRARKLKEPSPPPPPQFSKVTPGRVSITAMNELQRITPLSYRATQKSCKDPEGDAISKTPVRGGRGRGALVTCTLDLGLKRGSEVGKVDDDSSSPA